MERDTQAIRRLGFLLTSGYSLMSYASVLEPFRAANILSRRSLYDWRHLSIDGNPVSGSHRAALVPDAPMFEEASYDAVFVLAAGNPFAFADRATFAWLRSQARAQVKLAGISGGPVLLARAGLLDGYKATVHWEHQTVFRETFPNVIVESGLYVIDRRRMTCAGGIAGLDLAIDLIERDHGVTLANAVSEWFIRTAPRHADRPQRMGVRERYGVVNDRMVRVLAEMESNIEEPRDREYLAQVGGVSVRQLERLFRATVGRSLYRTYMQIRLNQALQLLRSTGMPIAEVAIACGFRSASHFSQAFRDLFEQSPTRARSSFVAGETTGHPTGETASRPR